MLNYQRLDDGLVNLRALLSVCADTAKSRCFIDKSGNPMCEWNIMIRYIYDIHIYIYIHIHVYIYIHIYTHLMRQWKLVVSLVLGQPWLDTSVLYFCCYPLWWQVSKIYHEYVRDGLLQMDYQKQTQLTRFPGFKPYSV